MRRPWRRRARRAQVFDWEARYCPGRGTRARVEVTGERLWELLRAALYSLAEATEQGGTRHDAWLDYSLAVYELAHRASLDVDPGELESQVDKAWAELMPELDATLRLSVPAANRLARSLSEVLQ